MIRNLLKKMVRPARLERATFWFVANAPTEILANSGERTGNKRRTDDVVSRILSGSFERVAVALLFILLSACSTRPVVEPVAEAPAVGQEAAPRPAYRYSVLPGGVRSADELRARLANDPVARKHYEGFRVLAHRPNPLGFHSNEKYFVSYRKGGRIFWTKHPISIPKGELVLVGDEQGGALQFVRARCGNRLSPTPRGPVARSEPNPTELETIERFDPPTIDDAARELPAIKELPLVAPPPRVAEWRPAPQPFVAMAGRDRHTVIGDPFMPGMLQGVPFEAGRNTPPAPGESPSPAIPFVPLPPVGNYPGIPDSSRPIEITSPDDPRSVDPPPPGPITDPPDDPGKPDPPVQSCCDVPTVPDPSEPQVPEVATPEPGTWVSAGVGLVLVVVVRRGR